jgi:hypothetical protein
VLTSIGCYAFIGCSSLTSVGIGKGCIVFTNKNKEKYYSKRVSLKKSFNPSECLEINELK